jgi:hypothetical protein
MSLEKVSLEEALRLGFGEHTVAIQQIVQKVLPSIKQRTDMQVPKPIKE